MDFLVRKLKMAVPSKDSKVSEEDVVDIAKYLCDEYIEDRLIRSGFQLKERKLCTPLIEEDEDEESMEQTIPARPTRSSLSLAGFGFGKSVGPTTAGFSLVKSKRLPPPTAEKKNLENISRVLISVGEILETRHSAVYNDVFAQLDISMLSELTLKKAFCGVTKQIFADGISWAKIVSLFAFSGALAVECVANCANTYVLKLKSWTVQFIADNLSQWIMLHDGWVCILMNSAKSSLLSTKSFYSCAKTSLQITTNSPS